MRSFDPQTRIITPEYMNSPEKASHGRKGVPTNPSGTRAHLTKRPVTPPEPYPGSPTNRHSLVPNEYGIEGDTDISRSNSPQSMTAMLVANSSYKRPPSPPNPVPNPAERIAHG
jgi:hypothetical protein